ncbi:MAG: hypothetical protein ACHREM_14780 [Polyangiales bacterium]
MLACYASSGPARSSKGIAMNRPHHLPSQLHAPTAVRTATARVAVCCALSTIATASFAASRDGDRSAPHQGAPPAEIDKGAVKRALLAVDYSKCGVTERGRLHITFEPTGLVSNVRIVGTYPTSTSECLVMTFGAVRVPPFAGPAVTYAWAIH